VVKWKRETAESTYGFNRWGYGYFQVDDEGFVCVDPNRSGIRVRILDAMAEAMDQGLKPPFLLRFQDILRDRVDQLNLCFRQAIQGEGYTGRYQGVFPVKVNQLREVVEEILEAGEQYDYGLEAGSKPELMITLTLLKDAKRLIICNGYKDDAYIRLALLGRKLGKKVILVIEQLSELANIIRIADEMQVEPLVGFRVKLLTQGEGKWAKSSGEAAKFGLTTPEVLTAASQLKQAGLQDSLRLLHFHVGSQVPNILTIKNAVIEATRYYCELKNMGFPMGYLDVGGGLGIDYDGSHTNFESSMNYTMAEYARDVVYNIQEVCQERKVKVPDIVSESGRAIVAPHSVLILEVFERISRTETEKSSQEVPVKSEKLIDGLLYTLNNPNRYHPLERYHDALQKRDEAFSLFNLGYLSLDTRAYVETIYWKICQQVVSQLDKSSYEHEELLALKSSLADQYVCNFSLFQSLLDHSLDQLFPVTPLHRLNEKPTVDATLVDITCDSDGKIDKFIALEDEVEDTLPLHPLIEDEPYYLGIFLGGAYQDIMGDMHNLFGKVPEAHVFLEDDEEDGFYIEEIISGARISDVLDDTQYNASDLIRSMKKQIDRATKNDQIKPREGVRLLKFYQETLQGTMYMEL